jgi:hypothetical protein
MPHRAAHFRSVAVPPPLAHNPIERSACAYDFDAPMASLAFLSE